MKKSTIVFYAALTIICEILWLYFCGVFVSQKLDPSKWAIEGRVFMVVILTVSIIAIISAASDAISKDNLSENLNP